MYYYLNDNTILRSDVKRTIIYSLYSSYLEEVDAYSKETAVFHTLSPIVAVAFYLMDGTRQLEDIILRIKKSFKKLKETDITNLLNNIENLKQYYHISSEKGKQIDRYRLKDILPNLNSINKYDMNSNYTYKPISLLFVVSFDCVTDCIYCYADRKYKYFPLKWEEVKSIIDEAIFELKVKEIKISGGDIFIYPYLFQLLELLSKNNYFPELPTKKVLDLETLKKLKSLGFKSFQYSIDSLDKDYLLYYLKIKNPDIYINDMLQSIKNAGVLGLKISINSVISKYNYTKLDCFLNKLLEFDNIFKINLTSVGYSLNKPAEMKKMMLDNNDFIYMNKKYKEIFQKVHKVIKFFKEPDNYACSWGETTVLESKSKYMDRSLCSAFRTSIVVLPDGKVTGCEELYYNEHFILGNLKNNTIMELWESEKREEIIFPNQADFPDDSICKYCDPEIFKECNEVKGRCWRESLKFYGRHEFPDYRCPIAAGIAQKHNIELKTQKYIWEINHNSVALV